MPIPLLPAAFGNGNVTLGDHAHAGNEGGEGFGPETLVGDVQALVDHAVGGDDTLTISTSGPNVVIGDAITIADHARGGNDVVTAGATTPLLASIDFNEDAPGQPPLTGGINEPTLLITSGGASVLVQSAANGISTQPVVLTANGPYEYADVVTYFNPVSTGVLRIEAIVSADKLTDGFFLGTSVPSAALSMLELRSTGQITDYFGNIVGSYVPDTPFAVRVDVNMDTHTWSATIDNELDGFANDTTVGNLPFVNPASVLPQVGSLDVLLNIFPTPAGASGASVAYDDISISNVSESTSAALGDAITLTGHAQGGNDTVEANSNATAIAYGDAESITDHARGGDDVVTGMSILGGDVLLCGDAQTLSGFAVGGDDTITGSGSSGGSTQMYGDSAELLDHARGGNDRLVSGPGSDLMWGDAAVVAPAAQTGADTFVFSPLNGHDTIKDFQPGKDHIELDGFEFKNFGDVASHIQDTQTGSLITFDANDSILVVGVHQLSASDFVLA